MSDLSVKNIIKKIISEVGGIDISLLEDHLKVREELMLDSLKEIEIAAKVERFFNISLNEKMLMKINTLNDFIKLVEKTIKKK
jgi:acyl carrier protein